MNPFCVWLNFHFFEALYTNFTLIFSPEWIILHMFKCPVCISTALFTNIAFIGFFTQKNPLVAIQVSTYIESLFANFALLRFFAGMNQTSTFNEAILTNFTLIRFFTRMNSLWLNKFPPTLKLFLQTLHALGFLQEWIPMCSLKILQWWMLFLQMSH